MCSNSILTTIEHKRLMVSHKLSLYLKINNIREHFAKIKTKLGFVDDSMAFLKQVGIFSHVEI